MMSIIYKILKFLLPERLIRTLFITSLYTKLFNVKTLDIRIYHKVNKLLTVCNNDYACGAGMSLAQVILEWCRTTDCQSRIEFRKSCRIDKRS